MRQFLKFTLATIVGLFLFSGLLFFILAVIGAAAASGDEVTLKDHSILKLSLDKPIQERAKKDPLLAKLAGKNAPIGLDDIIDAIERAGASDKVDGIYLDVSIMGAGFAQMEEIRNALIDFKKKGKFIVAYGELYSEGSYYLASVADEIYLNPEGALEFNGLVSNVMFFKGALDKLEIKPEIFRVGQFKSAVEPFFLDKMSPANRMQISSFLNSIYNHYIKQVAAARGVDENTLHDISKNLKVQFPEDAVQYKLVTGLSYYDSVEAKLKKRTKVDADEDLEFVTVKDVLSAPNPIKKERHKSKIAVVYASGEINSGEGSDDAIGSETIVKAMKKAREDSSIKAVVLRINSPGGSALASDVMWREIVLTRKTKPVIASMSDVAASGGYYMAMGADKIVAYPNTITGSIGVFGVLFDASRFLNNKIGLTFDTVRTGNFSDLGNPTRPMTDAERQIVQRSVDRIYDKFTTKAAEARKMPVEKLRELAGGRVYSGTEAHALGLVDTLGNMEVALKLAARAAKLDKYSITTLPKQKGFIEEIFGDAETSISNRVMHARMGDLYPIYMQFEQVKRMQGVQARMPFSLTIQ